MGVESVTTPHIYVTPFADFTVEINSDSLTRIDCRNTSAGALAHASSALTAKGLAAIHFVIFKLCIGKEECHSLERSKLGSQKHFTPAYLTKTAGNRNKAKLELQIGCYVVVSCRTGELNASVMRRRGLGILVYLDLLLGRQCVSGASVHIGNASASTCISVNECLVALVLDKLSYVVKHRGGEDLVDSTVSH